MFITSFNWYNKHFKIVTDYLKGAYKLMRHKPGEIYYEFLFINTFNATTNKLILRQNICLMFI